MHRKFYRTVSLVLAIATMLLICLPVSAAESTQTPKLAAITFDDGPSGNTQTLLDGLAKRGARATFFISGYRISYYPGILKAIVDGGHQLANHTQNHKDLTTLSASGVQQEVSATRSKLVEAGGDYTYYIRPPYGSNNSTVRSNADAPLICWSVDTLDWKYQNADTVCSNILRDAYDGCIILLHDLYSSSVNGALAAIDALQKQGYEFVTVEELLLRRGITPENGVVYYDARNKGITLGANEIVLQSYNESKLPDHWAYESILFCSEKGYMPPDGRGFYYPDRSITRGDFIAALGAFCGVDASSVPDTDTGFDDVAPDSPYAPYVRWSLETGLMVGHNRRFRPNSTLTREEMATVVARYLNSIGKGDAAGTIDGYSDAATISGWAAEGVAMCTELGILNGTHGEFRPKGNLTRAQTAAILHRLAQMN